MLCMKKIEIAPTMRTKAVRKKKDFVTTLAIAESTMAQITYSN